MPPVGQPVADLRQYPRILWRRKRLVVVVVLLAGATTWLWSARQPSTYVARAEVQVLPLRDQLISPVPGGANESPNLETEALIVSSTDVADRVRTSLGTSEDLQALLKNLEVAPIQNTDVLSISYAAGDPETAVARADAFAAAYVQQRIERAREVLGNAQAFIEEEIGPIRTRIAALTVDIAATDDPVRRGGLQSELDILVARLQPLEASMLELEAAAVGAQGGLIVQGAADAGARPTTHRTRNVVLGLLGGLVLGIALAFAVEGFDARVTSREQIETELGAPVLGFIPSIPDASSEDAGTIVRDDPTNQTSEAYRSLAINLLHTASATSVRTVMVTSALSGEGKSTTAANIATVIAQAGRTVTLVSGDLRRPRIHEMFGIPNETGFSTALSDSAGPGDVTWSSEIANLSIIPSGPAPDDPVALLAGERTAPFLGQLREAADIVIIDAPPMLPLADASILASISDATVLVVDAQRSDRDLMTESRERIETAGGSLIGVVYSNVRPGFGPVSAAFRYRQSPSASTRPARRQRRGSSGGAASDRDEATTW